MTGRRVKVNEVEGTREVSRMNSSQGRGGGEGGRGKRVTPPWLDLEKNVARRGCAPIFPQAREKIPSIGVIQETKRNPLPPPLSLSPPWKLLVVVHAFRERRSRCDEDERNTRERDRWKERK